MSGSVAFVEATLSRDNIDEVVGKVIPVVRPEWNVAKVETEILNKGLLNLIVLCHPENQTDNSNIIVVKTADEFFAGPIADVQHTIKFVDQQGFGPGVLCFFNNGLAMKHTIGSPLTWNDQALRDEKVWKAIAAEMARWHQRSMLEKARTNGVRNVHILWGDLINNYETVRNHSGCDEMRHLYPTYEELTNAERELRERLLMTDELEVAFTHGDMNGSNLAPYQNGIQAIDYDFTGICYSQIDLAWYFGSFLNIADMKLDSIPDKDYEMKFLQHYLEERKKLDGLDKSVERLYVELQKAKLFICLRYILSGPSLLYLRNMGTLLDFSADRWREFREKKDIVLSTGEYRTDKQY